MVRKTDTERRVPWRVVSAMFEAAADLRGLETWQILHVTNKRKPSHARFAIMWALRQYGIVWTDIGRWLGMSDHVGAIHGVKVATLLREGDQEYEMHTDMLLDLLHREMAEEFGLDQEAA